ncbi:hypothetical protein J4407_01240 [Candidatus Pacearchaeota archaeon]|nr:hypothetical protein [Candidatus Pacearchaeota archaeon]
MAINIFYFSGIVGLLLIIAGVLIKKKDRKIRDILYIIGGTSLIAYSFYIKDAIFITLQIVFVLVAVYDLILQMNKGKVSVKKPRMS